MLLELGGEEYRSPVTCEYSSHNHWFACWVREMAVSPRIPIGTAQWAASTPCWKSDPAVIGRINRGRPQSRANAEGPVEVEAEEARLSSPTPRTASTKHML
jgi:hypothetical protein